jgi:hypothetical protein
MSYMEQEIKMQTIFGDAAEGTRVPALWER